MKVLRANIVALMLVLAFAGSSLTQKRQAPASKQRSDRTLSARQIARVLFPSVVVLLTKDANGKDLSLGSGFFIQNDVIATAYHVIKEAARVYAKPIGARNVFEVVGTVGIDDKRDLALLKVKGIRGRPLPIGNISDIEVGDQVYTIGNPEGLEGTFSQGIVSAIRGNAYIQITASISHGSSGGPLLNTKGEVIGIAVGAIEEGQNLNFAISVSILSQLISHMTSTAPLVARTRDEGAESDNGTEAEWDLVTSNDGLTFYRHTKRTSRTLNGTVLSWERKVPNMSTSEGRQWQRDTADFLNKVFALRPPTPFKGLRAEMYSYDVDLVEYNCASGSYRRIQIRYYDKQGTLLYVNEATQEDEWRQIPPASIVEKLMEAACRSVTHR